MLDGKKIIVIDVLISSSSLFWVQCSILFKELNSSEYVGFLLSVGELKSYFCSTSTSQRIYKPVNIEA